MLGRFGRDAGSLLGVEIASGSVRILQLQRRQGGHAVCAWAVEPFEAPPGHWSAHPDVVAKALQRAWQRSGSRQRKAAVALPGSEVICKVHRLPARLSDSEMEAQLLAEAERLFPFPLQDLALDFQTLEAVPGPVDEVSVLVGACRHCLLEPLEQVFHSAGLQLVMVEVDSLALARTLAPGRLTAAAVLRIEAVRATVHTWSEPFMPQRLELRFVPEQDQAQRLARIGHWLRSALPGTSVECLHVAPCDVPEDGWLEGLAQQLAMPCESLWPFAGLALAGLAMDSTLSCREAGGMALAYGLALGGGQ